MSINRRDLRAWLADVLLGPPCPVTGCDYRARGDRSLKKHARLEHDVELYPVGVRHV